MRDDSYDEALARKAEQHTAEDMAAAARFADAAGAMAIVTGAMAVAVEALEVLGPPDPETIREANRRVTIELLKRGVVE